MAKVKQSDNGKPTLKTRGPGGTFAKGNPGGPGNPLAKVSNKFKSILHSELTEPAMRAIARKLISEAKTGDIHAIRELFERAMGKVRAELDVSVSAKPSLADDMLILEQMDASMPLAGADALEARRLASDVASDVVAEGHQDDS